MAMLKAEKESQAQKLLKLGYRQNIVCVLSELPVSKVRALARELTERGHDIPKRSGPAPTFAKILKNKRARIEASLITSIYAKMVPDFSVLTLKELEYLHQSYKQYLGAREDIGFSTQPLDLDLVYTLVNALRITNDGSAFIYECTECRRNSYVAIDQKSISNCVYCSLNELDDVDEDRSWDCRIVE